MFLIEILDSRERKNSKRCSPLEKSCVSFFQPAKSLSQTCRVGPIFLDDEFLIKKVSCIAAWRKVSRRRRRCQIHPTTPRSNSFHPICFARFSGVRVWHRVLCASTSQPDSVAINLSGYFRTESGFVTICFGIMQPRNIKH